MKHIWNASRKQCCHTLYLRHFHIFQPFGRQCLLPWFYLYVFKPESSQSFCFCSLLVLWFIKFNFVHLFASFVLFLVSVFITMYLCLWSLCHSSMAFNPTFSSARVNTTYRYRIESNFYCCCYVCVFNLNMYLAFVLSGDKPNW